MKRIDPRPPLTPTLDEQRDALRKGLGRAVRWALAGMLEDEPLLEACRRNLVYDTQLDGLRGDWLWGLIQTVDGAKRFREPLLEAVMMPMTESDDIDQLADDIGQLAELAYFYAAQGDADFRSALYTLVEHNPFPKLCPGLAEKEIVRLDGGDGFLFAARVRGARPVDDGWELDDDGLGEYAVEQLGLEHVVSLLENSDDSALRIYHARWREAREKEEERDRLPDSDRGMEAYATRMKRISLGKILDDIRGTTNMRFILGGWGAYASDEDLRTVLDVLWSTESPIVIVNALAVFAKRPLPTFDPRLIELCEHADEDVRWQANWALRMNPHPLVREYALSLIHAPLPRTAAMLFILNHERGDEELLMDALVLPNDVNKIHWLLWEILNVLEENDEADPSSLGLVIYAHTPCQQCRAKAVRLLRDRTTLPDWMPDECRHDAEEECRKLFDEPSETDDPPSDQ